MARVNGAAAGHVDSRRSNQALQLPAARPAAAEHPLVRRAAPLMRSRHFANDGGPLIVMDADLLSAWEDSDATYERACRVDYPAGIVVVPNGVAIVIGSKEDIATARWHDTGGGQAYLVGCIFGDDESEADLERALSDPTGPRWSRLGEVSLTSGRLILFHAGCAGAEIHIDPAGDYVVIGDALSLTLVPGPYEVATCELSIPHRALYNVVRWSRLPSAS